MGNCWAYCVGLFRREASRIQRGGGGGSKYFRSSTTGEHYTIEFENLVESDEAESPQPCPRPINEDEIKHLRDHQYTAISDQQILIDQRIQAEAHARGEDLDVYIQNVKAQSEAFRSSRLSSEPTVLTPNTESSWDFNTKTRSTNDDGTSLDLEWEDEEGMNRTIPAWERSRTEEDILRAALRPGVRPAHSGPPSASEESTGLEWENDFVSGAHAEENEDSEFEGFVNPVLDTPTDSDGSIRLDGLVR
ncbi:hypothetical protein NHX12_011884 [Muraenolepis orangiensis]|uniref:AP-1 complex-associated regulatory protein n=1 Tax=Muraenolepis orangiensis TaxID=630683 RepID=A0A9Q0DH99_9TELE|nr:hypothetical protein NHX12_011884 [Muraenolepis orangiensis]